MKEEAKSTSPLRRKLLMALGLAPAGAAILARAAPLPVAAPVAEPEAPAGSRGYHETEHIRTYYRTAALM
jgi:hypothetical protein